MPAGREETQRRTALYSHTPSVAYLVYFLIPALIIGLSSISHAQSPFSGHSTKGTIKASQSGIHAYAPPSRSNANSLTNLVGSAMALGIAAGLGGSTGTGSSRIFSTTANALSSDTPHAHGHGTTK